MTEAKGLAEMCNPVSTAAPDLLIAKGVHLGFEWEVTSNRMAYRCGYVRIPPAHPWHGVGYDDVQTLDGGYPDVHGGLTFAEPDTHCGKGGPDDAWWLGFDCAHAGDAPDPDLPGYREAEDMRFTGFPHHVRGTEYVKAECLNLIEHAAELLDGPIAPAEAMVAAAQPILLAEAKMEAGPSRER